MNKEQLPEGAITPPPFCAEHIAKIVKVGRYKDNDTWRALCIVSLLTMFQGATVTPSVQKKLDGKIERISELKCLACCLPVKFESLLHVLRQGKEKADLGDIKRLGEKWIQEAKNGEVL